jgi:hypothetical protein
MQATDLTEPALVIVIVPHDADYYRARAMEERQRAQDADRVYLRTIHHELAAQLDRRADECADLAEEFDVLTERASKVIRERQALTNQPPI